LVFDPVADVFLAEQRERRKGEVRGWSLTRTSWCQTCRGPGQNLQPELTHLNLVAVGQRGCIDRLPVDACAVEAADVDYPELASFAPELGVMAADGLCRRGRHCCRERGLRI
jgi:hypothetical protein